MRERKEGKEEEKAVKRMGVRMERGRKGGRKKDGNLKTKTIT